MNERKTQPYRRWHICNIVPGNMCSRRNYILFSNNKQTQLCCKDIPTNFSREIEKKALKSALLHLHGLTLHPTHRWWCKFNVIITHYHYVHSFQIRWMLQISKFFVQNILSEKVYLHLQSSPSDSMCALLCKWEAISRHKCAWNIFNTSS